MFGLGFFWEFIIIFLLVMFIIVAGKISESMMGLGLNSKVFSGPSFFASNKPRRKKRMTENVDNWKPISLGPNAFAAMINTNHGLDLQNNALACLKCGSIRSLHPCSNCGNQNIVLASGPSIGCLQCNMGYSEWTCDCGCKNPITPSTLLKKGGGVGGPCFVATAVFNSPLAFEVQTLRDYRDNVLIQHYFGAALIWCYNQLGPYLAGFIYTRPKLKGLVRSLIINPAIWYVTNRR